MFFIERSSGSYKSRFEGVVVRWGSIFNWPHTQDINTKTSEWQDIEKVKIKSCKYWLYTAFYISTKMHLIPAQVAYMYNLSSKRYLKWCLCRASQQIKNSETISNTKHSADDLMLGQHRTLLTQLHIHEHAYLGIKRRICYFVEWQIL